MLSRQLVPFSPVRSNTNYNLLGLIIEAVSGESYADYALPKGFLPSGQLISSAEDMAHYLIAHLKGGSFGGSSLLSPGGIKELYRPAVAAGATDIDMGEYAMGWFVEKTEHGRLLWHDGTTPGWPSFVTATKWW